jgi:hypothetical protein
MLYKFKYWILFFLLISIIFWGPKYKNEIVFIEKPLLGKVIFVDPGHGSIANSK